jgi:hypothetical protein
MIEAPLSTLCEEQVSFVSQNLKRASIAERIYPTHPM